MMQISREILEWRQGCGCVSSPQREDGSVSYSACDGAQVREAVATLYGAVTRVAPAENNWLGSQVLVEREHVETVLREFFRLDKLLREQFPDTCPNSQGGPCHVTQA